MTLRLSAEEPHSAACRHVNEPEVVFLDLEDVLAAGRAVLGHEPDFKGFGLLESALWRL